MDDGISADVEVVTTPDVGTVTGTETNTGDQDIQMQTDDPDGENFDYDKWAEDAGLRKPSRPPVNAEKIKADHDKAKDQSIKGDEPKGANQDQNKADPANNNDKPDASQKFEMKLKINGEEKTYNNMDEVQKLAQKGEAAEQKFFQATKIQNETKELLETLRDDPAKIFRNPKFGPKFREAAEKFLYDEMMIEQMPQEQRDGEIAKRELAEMREQQEHRQQQDQDQQQQNMTNHFKQQFTANLTETLKISGLPDTQDNRLAIVNRMKVAISNNIPIDPNAIADDVRGTFNTNTNQSLSNMTSEDLAKTLGPENVEKLIKYRMKEIKTKQAGTQKQSSPRVVNRNSSSTSSPKRAKTYSSSDDLMDDVWSGYS